MINKKTKEAIVKFKNVNFTYKNSNRKSLENFNLDIHSGEFILLTGVSGCGKTTAIRCINGLIPEFYSGELEGDISIYGVDTKNTDICQLSSDVGSVFQDPRSQFFTLHVKTEIAFPSENHGIAQNIMQNNIRKTISELKVEHLLDKEIFSLSSGEKQKVAIASIYALSPRIFVLDEPSANLDEEGTKELYDILKTLKSRGHTIIIAEHKLYYCKDLIDRMGLMESGSIKKIISGHELKAISSKWFEKNGLRKLEAADLNYLNNKIKVIKEKTPLLSVKNLSFGYKRKEVLWSDVNFEAYSGEVVGIVGKNGAGKSTLAKVLMGLEKQRTGEIHIDGRSANAKIRRKNSFYVMQDVDYQLFSPSVIDELMVGGKEDKLNEEKAEKYLRKFGLNEYKEVHPASLSGGQKQRLAIALACMKDYKILFFDEPTSGLDGRNMREVSNTIKSLAEEGRCILVITHDYEFAVNTFHKVIEIDGYGKVNSVFCQQELQSILS